MNYPASITHGTKTPWNAPEYSEDHECIRCGTPDELEPLDTDGICGLCRKEEEDNE